MHYAQIDSNNIVIGISMLSGEIENEKMIPIKEYDIELLGKKYDSKTKTFIKA